METALMPYSAARTTVTLLRNGTAISLTREEAIEHAGNYIGTRVTSHEIASVYVEGDEEAGVIMAIWTPYSHS